MKNYLIIGASSGIGKALAINLAKNNHCVFATYNNTKPDIENTAIKFVKYNAIEDATIPLEMLHLDGIVYCPGAITLKPFAKIKPEDFSADYNLQVLGAIKVIQQYLSILKKGNNPSIVLFSTVAVAQGFSFHSLVSSSKGAIEGLTKALASEFSPDIRVNCIAPSLTNTPLASQLLNTQEKININAIRHPLKRIGEPDDIASIAEFLLSDKASWITGQIFHVDGGMSTIKL